MTNAIVPTGETELAALEPVEPGDVEERGDA